MKRILIVLAASLVLAAGTPACGGNEGPPPAPPKKEAQPSWHDIWDTTPDIYVVLRPQAIKRDAVYGSFWKSLLRVAEAKHILSGQSMLEAAEGADEIVVGINPGVDAAMVIRGVPASLDAGKINDGHGRPLFRLANDKAKVPEYQLVDRQSAIDGSMFVLPDRVWVGAVGDARTRARTAFATPFGRPAPKTDNDSIALARFGQQFLQQPQYVKSQVWGPFTKKLYDVTISLRPGKEGVLVALHYEDEGSTAYAEMQAKKLVAELAKDEKRWGWLKDATVAYEGNTVNVRLPVPARLVEELPNASGRDMPM